MVCGTLASWIPPNVQVSTNSGQLHSSDHGLSLERFHSRFQAISLESQVRSLWFMRSHFGSRAITLGSRAVSLRLLAPRARSHQPSPSQPHHVTKRGAAATGWQSRSAAPSLAAPASITPHSTTRVPRLCAVHQHRAHLVHLHACGTHGPEESPRRSNRLR